MPIVSDPHIFEGESYLQANVSRLQALFLYIHPETLAGKQVLELGCGTGSLGEEFVRLGCRVVSVDANEQYIDVLRQQYPDRETYVMNLEDWNPADLGVFDVVLCFGLLYHISNPTAFLAACAQSADEMYLETVVCDSEEAICRAVSERGPDQSYSGFGCRPSPSWISLVMNRYGWECKDISSAAANWGGEAPSIFDWVPQNDGGWLRGNAFLRKMFVCARQP